MDQATLCTIIICFTIIVLSVIFKNPLSHLVKNTRKLSIKSKKSNISLETHEELNGALIDRTENESTVIANEIDKASKEQEIFKINESLDFYDSIAYHYSSNNTDYLWETHKRIVKTILINIPKNPHILDLGGGTGRLIVSEFQQENIDQFTWTNYDFSPKMLDVYKEATKHYSNNYKSINANILNINTVILPNKVDVIILCFVLSSMKILPSFKEIRNKMNKGGIIIIADGDPDYTHKKGYRWPAKVDDITKILNIKSINVPYLLLSMENSGFSYENTQIVKKVVKDEGLVDYSFILTFRAV